MKIFLFSFGMASLGVYVEGVLLVARFFRPFFLFQVAHSYFL